jgi:hypothetical protein
LLSSRNVIAEIDGKDVLRRQLFGRLIHSCTLKPQRPSLGQISIGGVGQYSIGVNMLVITGIVYCTKIKQTPIY